MRSHLTFLLFVLLAGVSPKTSRAEIPEADKSFLDDAIPALRAITEKRTGGPQNAAGALSGVRDLLAERRKARTELGKKHPLTDLSGIETQDEYDSEVMASLRQIVTHSAVASDSANFPAAATRPIQAALEALPPLGKQPIPLMVLDYSEMALTVGDSLVARGTPAPLVDHVILGQIGAATDLAIKEGEDFFGDSAARGLRQELVLARMRCPKDNSTYKMNTMKNQIKEDGGISTIYYVQCAKCGEARSIEFPQELASRLNRMSEQQKQTKRATPTRSQVVEP